MQKRWWVYLVAGTLMSLVLMNATKATELTRGYRRLTNIPYAHPDGQTLFLDLYLPVSHEGRIPVVLWVHGGGWATGSKDDAKDLEMGPWLARAGYAVASIDYRLAPSSVFPAQIIDCKTAVRWLRAHAAQYELDPDRIGASGMSAGGHLVALLGTSGDTTAFVSEEYPGFSSAVCATCDWFGPTDLSAVTADGASVYSEQVRPIITRFLGAETSSVPARSAQANPLTYITPNDPPFLILHGDKDPIVPLSQSQLLDAALRKAGVNSTLFVVPGGWHGFWSEEANTTFIDFLDRHVKHSAVTRDP